MKQILILILILGLTKTNAQNIEGLVLDVNQSPIVGGLVHWKSNKQSSVFTDTAGHFKIASEKSIYLIFSSVGYKTDSVKINADQKAIKVTLKEAYNTLEGVTIKGETSFIDNTSAAHLETLTAKSLVKAACCNLSESFETNASVSVSFSDAVTGAKQIQMLGLNGPQIQTNVENSPNIRGLASTFGLNYIPGTAIQSIDIAKGIGSVVNGYENIAGTINVELKKPDLAEKLLLNLYLNNFGRSEVFQKSSGI